MRFVHNVCVVSVLSISPSLAAQGGGSQLPVGPEAGLRSSGPATLVVTTMPGFPNEPRILPSQRHPVRPDTDVVVWGSVNHGDGTGFGATYSWSFAHGADVDVLNDGDLTGVVSQTHFIEEVVRFELQGGATSAIVKAVLECSLNGQVASREVEIAVVSNADPISDSPLERIEFDRQVAVENGLRYLYLNHANGQWSTLNGIYTKSATAFAVWAFEIHDHVPINDPDEDVYVPLVKSGLRHLTEDSILVHDALNHNQADAERGAADPGKADQNLNGAAISLTNTNRRGYEQPMCGSAIIASLAPDMIIEAGELKGLSLRTVVEDFADRLAGGITVGVRTTDPDSDESWTDRGGWGYGAAQINVSDMSINSWAYVFFEGAESVFGVDVPDWVKQETEWTLVGLQGNPDSDGLGDLRRFNYRHANLNPQNSLPGMATTGGGLSGLVWIESLGTHVPPGQIIEKQDAPLNTIEGKRQEALEFLGEKWGAELNDGVYGDGNRGNPYNMWTVARALRLTAESKHLPDGEVIPLSNGGVSFDWETGFEYDNGIVAPMNTAREGYFPYLIRTQLFDNGVSQWGRWNGPSDHYSNAFTTAAYVLVLGRDVFLPAGCEEPVAAPENLVPAPGSVYPTGETIILSGLAVRATLDREILGVLVDGQVPEVVDSQWNFFQTTTVQPGLNTHIITIIDTCGTDDFPLEFTGLAGGEIDFENLSEATPLIATEYTNTTWAPGEQTLRFDVEPCNLDQDTLEPPLVLVFENLVPGDAVLLDPDGQDENGNPFVRFAVDTQGLAPGACAPPRQVAFQLQELAQLNFEAKWFAEGQLPPEITTIPIVMTGQSTAYSYDADAVDPNQTPLTWTLPTGPAGMTIDGNTGLLTWDPTSASPSQHLVRIRVEDTDGDFAEQSFSLSVSDDVNRPPFFVSLPITTGEVDIAYEYAAFALDLDHDVLQFQLLEGPPGMTVDPDTGWVTWLPDSGQVGVHDVELEADDGNGGTAVQSFAVEIVGN